MLNSRINLLIRHVSKGERMLYFQNQVKKEIQKKFADLEVFFSVSPNVETGHLSIPCFNFSKVLKRAPNDIAIEISELITQLFFIEKVEIVGGYINCFIKKDTLCETIITEVLTQ